MKRWFALCVLVVLSGCAGTARSCSSFSAESFGADWIVVQYRTDGTPLNCWKLKNASITNEQGSDGIYWKDPESGHLVHISGWYNRVQVTGNNYEEAARLVGVDMGACGNGKYPSAPQNKK